MNRIAVLTAAVLIGVSSFSIANAQDKSLKVAIVDMPRVLKEYYKTQDAQKRIADMADNYQKEFDDRKENYGKIVEQIRALQDQINDKTLSETLKKEKTDLITQKEQEAAQRELEMKNFLSQSTHLLEDQRRTANDGIMSEINKAVTKVSKLKGYNLVLVKAEFPSPVLYSDISDISTDVITELNKDKPAAAAASH